MRGRTLLIIAGVIVAALGVTYWEVFGSLSKDGIENIAISQQSLFLEACKSYRHQREGDKFPAKLSELVAPTDGRKPLVDGGEVTLLDPWGKPFRYAVGDTEAGQVAYVWCELEVDGKLHGFGARLTPDGKIRRFKIADD